MRLKDVGILLAPVVIVILSMVAIPYTLLPSTHPLSPLPAVETPTASGAAPESAPPAATPGGSGAATPEPAAGSGTGEGAAPAATPAAAAPAAGGAGNAANGAALFATKGCGACHTIADVPGAAGQVGPELTHIGTVAQTRKPGMDAEAYIRESIQAPAAFTVEGFATGLMPTLPLTDAERDDIVAMLLAHQ